MLFQIRKHQNKSGHIERSRMSVQHGRCGGPCLKVSNYYLCYFKQVHISFNLLIFDTFLKVNSSIDMKHRNIT